MKSTIPLLENEKILFECAPQQSVFFLYIWTAVRKYLLYIVLFFVYVKIQGLKISQLTHYFYQKDLVVIIAVCVLFILFCIYTSVRVKQFHYIITNQRCISYGGLWSTISRSAPLDTISDIAMKQDLISSLFKLHHIILTQNTTIRLNKNKPVCFAGISEENAEKISNLLSGLVVKNEGSEITIAS